VLEYMPKGDLRSFLNSISNSILTTQRLQWLLVAVEAVQLLHDHGILHSDIKPANFLVDKDNRLRIIDFSGSAIDNKRALVLENDRVFLPRSLAGFSSSVSTDLLAFGSTMYEIMTGTQPFAELDGGGEGDEVQQRYMRQEFPSVEGIACGQIIRNCWTCSFDSAKAVDLAIRAEIKKVQLGFGLGLEM
jgi:serine/threonine protein kinase